MKFYTENLFHFLKKLCRFSFPWMFCFFFLVHSLLLWPFVLRWPNTVFTRAFADVIQLVHKDCKNKHVNRAIILFIQNPHYLRYFSLLLKAVYWWLYSVIKKDMLGKVTTQKTQKFLAFLCYRKNPVKCSACAVARKIETECFCKNLPISNDPVVRISRNLAKK